MAVHIFNCSLWEAEAGMAEFRVSLGYRGFGKPQNKTGQTEPGPAGSQTEQSQTEQMVF